MTPFVWCIDFSMPLLKSNVITPNIWKLLCYFFQWNTRLSTRSTPFVFHTFWGVSTFRNSSFSHWRGSWLFFPLIWWTPLLPLLLGYMKGKWNIWKDMGNYGGSNITDSQKYSPCRISPHHTSSYFIAVHHNPNIPIKSEPFPMRTAECSQRCLPCLRSVKHSET